MILAYTLNKILRMDPDSGKYLQPLAGKNIAIFCTDLNKGVYLNFSADYVALSLQAPAEIAATIQGATHNFLGLILNHSADLRAYDITVHGDLFCAESLQKLFVNLNVDWEEELSKHTDDIIAHKISYQLRQLRTYQQNSSASLGAMITEYLQEEARILPTKAEINEFMQEVDQLRLAVDRLAARIEVYENN